mmetsp:Transcript_117840/g.340627  ORF Transcript_117840/g.340627 Transcript_117840/m.340627 type:complete len:262 (+) Transcript_117840:513-1298(+)
MGEDDLPCIRVHRTLLVTGRLNQRRLPLCEVACGVLKDAPDILDSRGEVLALSQSQLEGRIHLIRQREDLRRNGVQRLRHARQRRERRPHDVVCPSHERHGIVLVLFRSFEARNLDIEGLREQRRHSVLDAAGCCVDHGRVLVHDGLQLPQGAIYGVAREREGVAEEGVGFGRGRIYGATDALHELVQVGEVQGIHCLGISHLVLQEHSLLGSAIQRGAARVQRRRCTSRDGRRQACEEPDSHYELVGRGRSVSGEKAAKF